MTGLALTWQKSSALFVLWFSSDQSCEKVTPIQGPIFRVHEA